MEQDSTNKAKEAQEKENEIEKNNSLLLENNSGMQEQRLKELFSFKKEESA